MARIFNRIIKGSIYLLVFLLPLFFLPFSFEPFEFNKQYLLFFLVSLSFLAWLTKMVLVDKEIRFRRTLLDIFVLVFLFVAILSTVFSVDKSSSLFGFYGRFSDGLIGLLSLGLLYFLITNNTQMDPDKNTDKHRLSVRCLLKVFLWSVFFVVLISYLSLFGIWEKLNSLINLPSVMLQATFNPVSGSMEGLAIFLAIFVAFLVSKILLIGMASRLNRLIDYLLLIASLFLLLIIDFAASWIILFVTLTAFVGFALWKRVFRERVNKLLLPIFLIVVAVTFLFVNTSSFQRSIFNFTLPQEQVLDQGESWGVGFKAATENVKSGFLGSGISTWHYDFAKFKSIEFNQTQIRFDRGGSHIAEILGTMGFLGFLSYAGLIGFFLLISYFFVTGTIKKGNLEINRSLQLPLLVAFLTIVLAQFVYYQNTALALMFWLVLGLSVVSWQKPGRDKVFSFKNFPELSLIFTVFLIIIGLAIAGLYYFAGRFYLADTYYKNAWGEAQIENLEKATKFNPYQPQYKIVLARTYLNRVIVEIQRPVAEQDQNRLGCDASLAVAYVKGGEVFKRCLDPEADPRETIIIKGAAQYNPNRVVIWETLGMIYREIRQVAAGALDWGITAFSRAIELEPTNPVFHTELGKLYSIAGQNQKAKEEFTKAKELKPDYIDIDALIQEALIYEKEDNLPEAIKKMESYLVSGFPVNIEFLFQLGRIYFNNNQLDEAIVYLQRILTIMPDHSNALYSLGVAYQRKGQTQEAIAVFEKVLEINPGNQDIINKLEELRKE